MLILRSDEVLARIDPIHGAEILDLVDLHTGRQLLGRLPFGSRDRQTGPLDELAWIGGWRGGWQICAPNPGNPCEVDGVKHGFHGTGSHEPWEVVEAGEESATLRWSGYRLDLVRKVSAIGAELVVETEVRSHSEDPVPFAILEHVSLGLELLDPVLELDLPAAAAIEVSDMDGPVRAPSGAPCWPEVLRLDGSHERGDRVELRGKPQARFYCVQDMPEGRALARGERAGLELTWDRDVMPHAWIWYEIRANGGPFRELAEIVAIEPSSVPHSLGLNRAIEEGQAIVLEPGDTRAYRFSARVSH